VVGRHQRRDLRTRHDRPADRGVAPFVFADTFRLAVLVLFPALTLWLPQALK